MRGVGVAVFSPRRPGGGRPKPHPGSPLDRVLVGDHPLLLRDLGSGQCLSVFECQRDRLTDDRRPLGGAGPREIELVHDL